MNWRPSLISASVHYFLLVCTLHPTNIYRVLPVPSAVLDAGLPNPCFLAFSERHCYSANLFVSLFRWIFFIKESSRKVGLCLSCPGSSPLFVVGALGMEPRASCMRGKCPTTELRLGLVISMWLVIAGRQKRATGGHQRVI